MYDSTEQSERAGVARGTVASGEDHVHGTFAPIARKYDRFNRFASLGIDNSWRRAAVAAAAIKTSSRVLDMCAGTGELSLAIARHGRPAEVVGVDIVPEMLAVAEQKARGFQGRTVITFTIADAHGAPFPDASFDVVTVAFGVRNVSDRAAHFAEVLRVLKPGGRYVILEFSQPPFAVWRWLSHRYLASVIPVMGGLFTGERAAFVYLNESIRSFPAQGALAAELRSAGFSAISWEDRSGGIVAIHTAVK
ncbi:MAG TPA: ubiquinone/menaquinone biosynthesis methyltransferase [Coriobacteriia bacterium]|nr:ubiquinone/menaquinone biosynthesis methyltransferase [Coriobacteriia bacterium]